MAPAVLSHDPQPPKPRCTQGWDDLVTLTTAYGHGCLHPPLLQFLSASSSLPLYHPFFRCSQIHLVRFTLRKTDDISSFPFL